MSGRVGKKEESTINIPNIAVEVGMTSALYNPVETCMMIAQMELVIWLRSQDTITHSVPYTREQVHSKHREKTVSGRK